MAVIGSSSVSADAMPRIVGWKHAGQPESYDRRTVWQAINGAAELYLAYGLERLEVQSYSASKPGLELELEVQLYDLAQPINAFGVFRRERPTAAKPIQAGTEAAFAAPHHCLAHKDRYYLKVRAQAGKLTADSCRRLLAALARALPGRAARPAQLQHLPAEGRIPGSTGFTRRGYLGLRQLDNCLHATYRDGQQRFVILPAKGGSVDALWRKLAKSWKPGKQGALERKVPYRGVVRLKRGRGGVLGVLPATPKD
jgi:hypothetical protein